MGIQDCKLIELPNVTDKRGSLAFIEAPSSRIPFEIKRVFYLFDVPKGQTRGAHAHRQLHQVLICLAGQVEVHLDDGAEKKTVTLQSPVQGLWVPPMVWASESNFSEGSICLVLASEKYDEGDYIRNHDEFLAQLRRS